MASSVATPSGWRNSTKAPSRTPSPEIPIGQHLGDGHRGEERQQRGEAGGPPDAEGLGGGDRGQHEHELVDEADDQQLHARQPGPAAQAVEAEVHRADEAPPPSRAAKRPPTRWLAAA